MNAHQRRVAGRSRRFALRRLASTPPPGYMPDLREWVPNQKYVRKAMTVLLVEAPKAFSLAGYRLGQRKQLRRG